MMKKLFACAACALALAGCQTAQAPMEKNIGGVHEKITNVVGNIWRIDAEWPADRANRFMGDALRGKASSFCARKDMGMIPLSGTVSDGDEASGAPHKAWLEFRCAAGQKVEREYKGLSFTINGMSEED